MDNTLPQENPKYFNTYLSLGITQETKQNPVLITSAHLAWFKAIDFGGLGINELLEKNF